MNSKISHVELSNKGEQREKNEESLDELWNIIKENNVRIVGAPEENGRYLI